VDWSFAHGLGEDLAIKHRDVIMVITIGFYPANFSYV
jgi:hypothetical protein